jgi:3-methyladenine DNA glycosylase AlkD
VRSTLRAALIAAAEPARAAPMQAYMKSAMPYFGVRSARVKTACREVFATYAFDDPEVWRADVLGLWRAATHREERYAAIALARHRGARPFQTLAALPMYEEMIVTGAWWDFVDELAAHAIGGLLASFPDPMRETMLAWSRSPDMWKARTSILCQLTFGEATDLALLYTCIEPSIRSKEFFLRKAIGWSLRHVARHDPAEVSRYVREHAGELSGLSRREALKHVSGSTDASVDPTPQGS